MTKEEYDDCVSKVDSEDIFERLQARMLLAMFPTYEAKIDCNKKGIRDMDQLIRGVLEQENEIV